MDRSALQRMPSSDVSALAARPGESVDIKRQHSKMLEQLFKKHQQSPKETGPKESLGGHQNGNDVSGLKMQGLSQQGGGPKTSRSTEKTTESDSEITADVSSESKRLRQGSGQKRPLQDEPSERQKFVKFQHIRGPGSFKDVSADAATGNAEVSLSDGLPPRPASAEPLQNLSSILKKHQYRSSQALADLQSSPFQDKPINSPVAQGGRNAVDFRSCFSEGSAHRLLGQEPANNLLANLQKFANSQQSGKGVQIPSNVLGPLLAIPNLAGLLASGAPVGQFPNFNTVNSNVESELHFDLSKLLSYGQRSAPPSAFLQAEAPMMKSDSPNLPEPKTSLGASLGAFGSIFPRSDSQLLAQRLKDSPGKSSVEKAKLKPNLSPLRPPSNSGVEMPQNSSNGPDPRILDWVLGNRPTITDRTAFTGVSTRPNLIIEKTGGSEAVPGVNQVFKREHSITPSNNDQLGNTLRRPVAIRPQGADPPPMPCDSRVEALISQLHGPSIPSMSGLPPLGKTLQKNLDPSPSSPEFGRVLQWAAQELTIRDNKVKEVEKQRDEERILHDAAMNAVATEVTRIKSGQLELAKTHWNLQDLLAKRAAEIEEKTNIISKMSTSIKDLEQEIDNLKGNVRRSNEDRKLLLEQIDEIGPGKIYPPAVKNFETPPAEIATVVIVEEKQLEDTVRENPEISMKASPAS